MEDFIYNHKKKIVIGVCVVPILIIAISIYFIMIGKLNSATVNIIVAPSIARVRIGDREFGASGTYKIQPGDYEIEVWAAGFISKTQPLTAVENETTNLKLYLLPEDDSNDWYEKNSIDSLIMGEVKSDEAKANVDALRTENPILDRLPIEIDYFTEGYIRRVKYTISFRLTDNNTDFLITITDYTGGNYDNAIARLKARDTGISNYRIEYEDVSNESYAASTD